MIKHAQLLVVRHPLAIKNVQGFSLRKLGSLRYYSDTKNIPKIQQQTEQVKLQDAQDIQIEKPISPHGAFYRQFGKPFTRICLISIGTYYSLTFIRNYLDEDEAKIV